MAARIGRDAVVDWMVVASIPLRDTALQIRSLEAAGCERIQFGTPIAPSTS